LTGVALPHPQPQLLPGTTLYSCMVLCGVHINSPSLTPSDLGIESCPVLLILGCPLSVLFTLFPPCKKSLY
jgi:hypothetical protein